MKTRNIIAAVALVAFLLTGCSQQGVSEQAKNATPADARSQTEDLFAYVTQVIPGAGWSETGKWVSCGEFDGEYYVKWTTFAQLFVAVSDAPREDAESVAGEWRRHGLDPAVSEDQSAREATFVVSDPPFLGGVHGDGSITQLFVSQRSATFAADSLCVRGDILELQPEKEPTVTPPSSP